ncbi:PilZ domain-containing protein [Rhodoblastus sp.]|uniref:PilZ domain-containing protein n=1 Tax=Rhodoblastus sp. TaxID=1962975 RepID=UPI002604CEDD|nr:PilZ domain-containing protein [Rhodoblastus sp.]
MAQKIEASAKSSLFSQIWRNRGPMAVVTYSAAIGHEERNDEKRMEDRRRTRLRAGKILDRANHFLIDATIIDRSCYGLRLRLARDIALPELFHFFDEESDAIFLARIAWRRQRLVGARRGPVIAATARQIAFLRGKFYAIKD